MIRSDKRLSYEDVDEIFAGERKAEDPWAQPLTAAREVSAARDEARRAGGAALAIESVEPEFSFDTQGHVADSVASIQTESHRLIEHLMIAANEAEKSSNITVVDVKAVGAFGRLTLAGKEGDVEEAAAAAMRAVAQINRTAKA